MSKNRVSTKPLKKLLEAQLWVQILIGLFLGFLTGLFLGEEFNLLPADTAKAVAHWLALPGYIFLNLIQMIIIPLILASVIRGIASSGDIALVRALGGRSVLYFLTTTAFATIIGASVALLIAPGLLIDASLVQQTVGTSLDVGAATLQNDMTWPQRVAGLLPLNPIRVASEGDMLKLVIFSALFGTALIGLPAPKAKPILDVLLSLQDACMVIIGWAMRLAPFAVFGLIAEITQKVGIDAFMGMGAYVFTVLLGLSFLFVFYMVVLFFIAKRTPVDFIRNIKDVLILAFSTSSSAAVMPVSLKVAEENLKVKPHIAKFVIPLGVTINMDGTALYQTVAAIFLAQIFAVDITFGSILIILATSIGASIGTPGTPGVGIIILASILMAVGIPPAGIALILGVDRILDMCRTTINVTGDLVASCVMDRWVKN